MATTAQSSPGLSEDERDVAAAKSAGSDADTAPRDTVEGGELSHVEDDGDDLFGDGGDDEQPE